MQTWVKVLMWTNLVLGVAAIGTYVYDEIGWRREVKKMGRSPKMRKRMINAVLAYNKRAKKNKKRKVRAA